MLVDILKLLSPCSRCLETVRVDLFRGEFARIDAMSDLFWSRGSRWTELFLLTLFTELTSNWLMSGESLP